VARYHRRYDPKEREASLKMLREVAKILRERSVSAPLLLDTEDGGQTEEQRKRLFFERHNDKRNNLHFNLGWPWKEIPTAATAWKAQEALLRSEPYVQIERMKH